MAGKYYAPKLRMGVYPSWLGDGEQLEQAIWSVMLDFHPRENRAMNSNKIYCIRSVIDERDRVDTEDLLGLDSPLSTLAFSHDGSHILGGLRDGTVRIWNCQTRQQISLYQLLAMDNERDQTVWSVAFSRDSSRCVLFVRNSSGLEPSQIT